MRVYERSNRESRRSLDRQQGPMKEEAIATEGRPALYGGMTTGAGSGGAQKRCRRFDLVVPREEARRDEPGRRQLENAHLSPERRPPQTRGRPNDPHHSDGSCTAAAKHRRGGIE